jgi:hypothetical protein
LYQSNDLLVLPIGLASQLGMGLIWLSQVRYDESILTCLFFSFWNQVLYYGVPPQPLCAIGTCVLSQTSIIWTFSKLRWKINVQILCQLLWWTIWLKEWSTRLDPCFLVAVMARQMCTRCISRWKNI